MKTIFLSLECKRELQDMEMYNRKQKAVDCLIDEIGRLENIIRNYETVLDMAATSLASNTFKEPKIN